MSIEKKSLISTLKTTKKANAVSSEVAKPTNVASKSAVMKRVPLRRDAGLKRNTVTAMRAEMRRAELRRAGGELKRAGVVQTKQVVVTKRRK